MINFHGCVWAWAVEGPPTLPSNISFQKMSRRKEIPFKKNKKCKGLIFGGRSPIQALHHFF
jgi:hypothetical protein